LERREIQEGGAGKINVHDKRCDGGRKTRLKK